MQTTREAFSRPTPAQGLQDGYSTVNPACERLWAEYLILRGISFSDVGGLEYGRRDGGRHPEGDKLLVIAIRLPSPLLGFESPARLTSASRQPGNYLTST
jgi:hypothetical protein